MNRRSNLKTRRTGVAIIVSTMLLLSACSDNVSILQGEGLDLAADSLQLPVVDADFEVLDWTDDTHSNDVDPNLAEVFNDAEVKRLDIVVTADRWQSMLDDMTAMYGEFGGSSDGLTDRPIDGPIDGPIGGPVGGRGAEPGAAIEGGGNLLESDQDPIFVPAEIFYNGRQWYRVGIRFKGNSTLQGSWQSGILKLSFKLDFDEYEDVYPQIDNQRFYGFKKFSLKNNYDDSAFMREKISTDIFRAFDVPASHAAFYTLYVDSGNGPEYFGVYTLVEEVDGSVLDTQFENDEGNLYKPEDGSANFVDASLDTQDFTKKTNEDDEDWSDIEAMFAALHAETRITDPANWRAGLEAVFEVDGFLRYLSVNTVIQNWDTYGRMPHNFYLYNNPETSKLTWIPWDNNESLQEGKQGGALSLDFSNLEASEWPLIAKIYADSVYKARYDILLAEVIRNAFEPTSMQSSYDNYSALIQPFAATELQGYSFLRNADEFNAAVETLKSHAVTRANAVNIYLNSQ